MAGFEGELVGAARNYQCFLNHGLATIEEYLCDQRQVEGTRKSILDAHRKLGIRDPRFSEDPEKSYLLQSYVMPFPGGNRRFHEAMGDTPHFLDDGYIKVEYKYYGNVITDVVMNFFPGILPQAMTSEGDLWLPRYADDSGRIYNETDFGTLIGIVDDGSGQANFSPNNTTPDKAFMDLSVQSNKHLEGFIKVVSLPLIDNRSLEDDLELLFLHLDYDSFAILSKGQAK